MRKLSLSLGVMQPKPDRRKRPGLQEGYHPDECRQYLCKFQIPVDFEMWRHLQGKGGTHEFLTVEFHSLNVSETGFGMRFELPTGM